MKHSLAGAAPGPPTKTTPTARAAINGPSRRALVKAAAVGLIGGAMGGGGSALLIRLGRSAPPAYQFFTDAEATLVIDLCEQIIPRDDTPGATDAGVIHFLDRQLATRLARHQKTYRQGLQAVAQTCHSVHHQPFAQLSVEQKIVFLRQVEAGKVPPAAWIGVTPSMFFSLLVSHTMQGFYGSPRHGGNRDYVSYKMLALDYPQVIGRNRHRRT